MLIAPLRISELASYGLKTLILVLFLGLALRVLGKREMAQLNIYDLAMVIAVSNAVQNAMTGGRGNLPVGLIVSSTIILAAWGLTRLFVRHPRIEQRVVGTPTILLHNGAVLRNRLRRERITPDELETAMRAHGIDRYEDVSLAVLEVDGSITVIPNGS